MQIIKVLEQKDIESGWEVKVSVDDLDFVVTVDKEYWLALSGVEGQELTGGKEDVRELVRRSFEFLLQNESKESILRRFNLREIEQYFPNYPKAIKM